MHPSDKKNTLNSAPFQSPAPKPKKPHSSINKSQRSFISHESTSKPNNTQAMIHKMMTEEPYTRIFNKLMNLDNLKEFVLQASQYVDFHQAEVKKYIPPTHTNKTRFSWSLKQPNSVCVLLERDYRFWRHYQSLLEKEFPQKINIFKDEIYQLYKDSVIHKKKFDKYFSSNQNLSSLNHKSNHKSHSKMTQKTGMNNQPKSISKSILKNKSKHSFLSSARSLRTKTSAGPSKTTQTNEFKQQKSSTRKIKFKKSSILQSPTHSQQIQQDKSYQNYRRKTQAQQNLIGINFEALQKAMGEVDDILSNSQTLVVEKNEKKQNKPSNSQKKMNSKRFISKSKLTPVASKKNTQHTQNNKKQNVSIVKKENNKSEKTNKHNETSNKKKASQIKETILETSDQNDKNLGQFSLQTYEEMITSKRKLSKSKKKEREQTIQERNQRLAGWQDPNKKRKPIKIIPISSIFDPNSPDFLKFQQQMKKFNQEKQKKRKQQKQKQEKDRKFREQVEKICSNRKREAKYPFGPKQMQALPPKEKQIVVLFPGIKDIGNRQKFTFDRDCFKNVQLGECNGYLLEVVFCWPKRDDDDQHFVSLYLKKVASPQKEQSNAQDSSTEIEKLKEKMNIYEQVKWINILFIEK